MFDSSFDLSYMCILFIIYLVIGIIMGMIYNYHAPESMKMNAKGIAIYSTMWPLMMLTGM